MFQAHFVLSCPQPRVSHLFQEILFFYLIIPLMSIQSPITALLPPLCRCYTLPAQTLILHSWIFTFPILSDQSSSYLDSDIV